MSMLLLDIAPGENRGPSMIPFTQDLDEGGDSGAERATSSNSSQSGGESDEGRGRLGKESPPTPPTLDEVVEQTTPIKGNSTLATPESSSNDSTPTSGRGSRLHSSLKIDTPQESNLECQAYTSSHLEALRLRHEAGKIRAYSFNDSLANSPKSSYNKHLEQKSASKAERKMPTISSPVVEAPVFNVLKSDGKITESVDTFVQVIHEEEDNKELLVPILTLANSGNEPALPRKDSNASHVSKNSKSSEAQLTSETTLSALSKSETKNSNQSLLSLRNSANNLSGRERSRSVASEKEDAASATSNALTVKSNNAVKSSEGKPIKEASTDAKSKQTMKEYIMNDLFNIDSQHQDGSATEDIDANMEEFLRVPFKLENLMFFSLAVCVDSFLYVWTMLPLKAIWGFVCLACTIRRPGKGVRGIQFHRR